MPIPHRHPIAPRRTLALLLALALLAPTLALAPPAGADDCTVTTGADDFSAASLRMLLIGACATLTFAPNVTEVALTVRLEIIRDVIIQGPGAANLAIRYAGSPNDYGSVAWVRNGTVTFRDLTIRGGRTLTNRGAGLIIDGSLGETSVTLDKVTLTDNIVSDGGGGGLYISDAKLALINTTVSDNTATGDTSDPTMGGAGLSISDTAGNVEVTLTNSVVSGNHTSSSDGLGGGIYVRDPAGGYTATVKLNDSAVIENRSSFGGGIYNQGGALTIARSTISGNTAWQTGGLHLAAGTTDISASTISGNTATRYTAGGIHVNGGTTTLTNVTISGNKSTNSAGGGLSVASGTAALRFVTLTGNITNSTNSQGFDSFTEGGGIRQTGGTVTVLSSIIAGNSTGTGAASDCSGSITSQGRNLWGIQAPCPNNTSLGDQNLITLNVALASVLAPALENNGGPTRTHNLVPGSAAIDHGDNVTCASAIPNGAGGQDQRGVPRNDGKCDTGAVEYTSAPPSPSPSPSPSASPCGTRFGDVPAADPACVAIEALAARNVIKGCDQEATPPLFCPTAPTLRAQMAALIVRAMAWGSETPANPFSDQCDPANPQNCIDGELWNAVGILGAKNVAKGYADAGTCAPASAPCYAPRDNVLFAQVISFITRAMVQKGYWTQATSDDGTVYPNIPQASGHRLDFVTYVANVGPVPGTSSATQDFAAWDQPSTRAWFAQALWQALQGH